jgi:hypothetical protein
MSSLYSPAIASYTRRFNELINGGIFGLKVELWNMYMNGELGENGKGIMKKSPGELAVMRARLPDEKSKMLFDEYLDIMNVKFEHFDSQRFV